MPTKSQTAKAVHRSLRLTTPLTRGLDVKALQESLKALFAHFNIDWLPLSVDEQVGPQTLHGARFLSWVLGLGRGHRKAIKSGVVPKATQELLRNPEKRSRLEKRRAKRRLKRLAKIRKSQSEGPAAAVAYARSFIGTTESPAGSNSGPTHRNAKGQLGGVTFWENYWGLGAAFWCLCFACYAVKAIGGARISGNCTYSVAIEEMARNHEGGWVQVPIGERRMGDISLWKFDGPSSPSDHGELVADPHEDIGGNTSSDTGGSQSNGGGVFSKDVPGPARSEAQLSMVARPLYS